MYIYIYIYITYIILYIYIYIYIYISFTVQISKLFRAVSDFIIRITIVERMS